MNIQNLHYTSESLTEKENYDYDNDKEFSLINCNFEPIFSVSNFSQNFYSLNLPYKDTQPTSSLPQNNNMNSQLQNNENKDNKKIEENKEKDKKEEQENKEKDKKEEEENKESKEKKKEKKMLGRKKKDSKDKGIHDKYSSDNIIRRIKTLILNNLLITINIFINKVYNRKIAKGNNKNYTLLKVDLKGIYKTGNKQFLEQTLEEIFSNNISKKCKKYQTSHNKQIISELLKEKDEEKRKKFNDLFKLTFLDGLKHFRESFNHEELEGLTTLSNIMSKIKDLEYSKLFKHYVLNFEEVIKNKKSKKSKEKN